MRQAGEQPGGEEAKVNQGRRSAPHARRDPRLQRQHHHGGHRQERQSVIARVLGLEEPEDRGAGRGGGESPRGRRQGPAGPQGERRQGADAADGAEAARRRLGGPEHPRPGVKRQIVGWRMGVGEGAPQDLAKAALVVHHVHREELVGPKSPDRQADEGEDEGQGGEKREDPRRPGGPWTGPRRIAFAGRARRHVLRARLRSGLHRGFGPKRTAS